MLTIDLRALADNYRLFQKLAGPSCSVAGIVKANAYGLGLEEVVRVLDGLSCPQYFVATIQEALDAKRVTNAPVAVLNGLQTAEQAHEYLSRDIMPVLNALHDIRIWQDAVKQADLAVPPPAIIHFDTGMNRLGLTPDETKTLLEDPDILEGLNVHTIMSHLSCADEENHKLTNSQYEDFCKIAACFPDARKSLANSSGLFRSPDYHFDMVRPGMALYGLNPTPEKDNPVKQIVSLYRPVLQVRPVRKGETAGYGATYRFEQDTVTATVAVGYADGFLRCLGNKGTLYYNGKPCPVIGRVSMDLTTIDLGPGSNAGPGDMVEIIGPHQSPDKLASDAGTIGYEILTSLGSRYMRRYIS